MARRAKTSSTEAFPKHWPQSVHARLSITRLGNDLCLKLRKGNSRQEILSVGNRDYIACFLMTKLGFSYD